MTSAAMPRDIRLYLVGYRATGKSTVGRSLAERLGWNFVDADAYLEATGGASIASIFAQWGEPEFRRRESAVLAELSHRERVVIATGGGVILAEANRRRLRESGYVVWLTADADTIGRRLQTDPTTAERRPNLTVGGQREIEELLAARQPLYREVADLAVSTEARSPDAIASAILAGWETFCSTSRSSTR